MFHNEKENDGTIAITREVLQPMQGTYIARDAQGKLVVAKGIIRPPLTDSAEVEIESVVEQAGFGRSICDALDGDFYCIREVGAERTTLAYQTILFALANPDKVIENDTKFIESLTALDLM